jgi:16S rRNA (cytosine1402-N4)-methyltransferase
MVHIPVLLKETIEALEPKPGQNFIDGTFGWGGHSQAILELTAPDGMVLGIEWDRESLAALPESIKDNKRLIIESGSYTEIAAIAQKRNFNRINGILLDLGMSSWHVDESGKGFSFSKDEPLDMRYSKDSQLTAAKIVNEYTAAELERIFRDYGQEDRAKKIAAAIVKARVQKRIDSTRTLSIIIERVAGGSSVRNRATKVFQALRIAVNREFENISQGIDRGFQIMENGGRMAVITFHSLEDGIVKRKFQELARSGRAKLIFKKPVECGKDEAVSNPRARSAKLRAIEKISQQN